MITIFKKAHLSEQALRAGRLFLVAMIFQVSLIPHDKLGTSTLISAGIAAVEVVYRQLFPAVPVRTATEVALVREPTVTSPPAVQ